ncbi:hypothetical protein GCM10023172_31950 [Hymenobacter ginsengisoli]|uniref:Uncharacterized protein n=1 Tax=Hymenobacter ginsengisoli TaxID=1051626 RepID=A0ABP8QKB3_9BACT|nr:MULTISPECIES: hypothetical protein [unclassified Hymenobacter]MBO2031267.1 hypothetical protein [Hymenobacter sp. BT559]
MNAVKLKISPLRHLTDAMRKIEHWLEAGARLGEFLVPATESAHMFAAGQPVRPVVG